MRSMSETTPALVFSRDGGELRYFPPRSCREGAAALRHVRDAETDDVFGGAAGKRAPSNSIAPLERTMLQIGAASWSCRGRWPLTALVHASLIEGKLKTVKRLDLAVIGPEIP